MKVLKKTDKYTIYQKRSGRYAVEDALGNITNGVEKVNILIKAGIVKQAIVAPAEEVVAEAAPAEEVVAEAAPAEEVVAEAAPAKKAPAKKAPAKKAPAKKAPAKKAPAKEG